MKIGNYWLVTLLLFLLISSSPRAFAQDAAPPQFDLHTVNGLVATGPLQQLGDGWSLSLGGDKPVHVQAGDLVSLRRAKTPLPAFLQKDFVLFVNGDRLPADLRQLSDEMLQAGARLQGQPQDVSLPQAALAVLWWTVPDGQDRVALLRRVVRERRRHDTLYLRNGDTVEGTLAGLDAAHLRLESPGGKVTSVERDKVALVALSTELVRTLRPRSPYARLVLTSGARLSFASAHVMNGTFAGKTLFGATVQLPVNEIIAVDIYQGPAVYLSDLRPRSYEHTPFFGVSWPYKIDASVSGRDLRLGGSTHDKGVGLHSASRLTFDLKGSYQWFEARVGLDDETGKQGSVRIQVLVDGKPQETGSDKELSAKAGPRALRVHVAGARELTLVVDFGRAYPDVQGQVDWADARLIR